MAETSIEWTDATWNPTTGCSAISPGCKFCYAFPMSRRLAGMGQVKYQGITGEKHFNGVLKTWDDELEKPLRWKKPRMIFVNSMSDLFHKKIPFEFVDKVFAAMTLCSRHTFQVLTKRADRMAEYFRDRSLGVVLANLRDAWKQGVDTSKVTSLFVDRYATAQFLRERNQYPNAYFPELPEQWPLPNVWLGVSVENQKFADERREFFRSVPAAIKFVSYEPALGLVDWSDWEFVDQIISGGESGPGARPSHPDWHRGAQNFCQANGIAYLFKQWGAWIPCDQGDCDEHKGRVAHLRHDGRLFGSSEPMTFCCSNCNGIDVTRVGKKAAGRLLDGREWNEFPKAETHA